MFDDMGVESMLQEFEPERYNTIGRINGSGGGATLLFNGHIDMSFTGDEAYLPKAPGYRPAAHVKDGWIHGMGIHNMKSGVAAFIAAAEAVAKAGPDLRGDILLACVGGEIERHAVVGYQGAPTAGAAAARSTSSPTAASRTSQWWASRRSAGWSPSTWARWVCA